MTTVEGPSTLRALDSAPAHRLAALASIFGELQTVLRCCERLMELLANRAGDDLALESLWTTALLSYSRCFTAAGEGVALTEADVTAIALQGEVLQWHGMLRRLREHFADPAHDPRERFAVGVAQDGEGAANAIAITSTPTLELDDTTVRQTGALALELSKLVDARMDEQQQRVLAEAAAMSRAELDRLPLIEVALGAAT